MTDAVEAVAVEAEREPTERETRRAHFETARKAAGKLLSALGVERIWVIDDQAIPGSAAFLAAWQSNRDRAPLPDDTEWSELDDDEWRAQVRRWFDEQDEDTRRDLNRRALKRLDTKPESGVDLDLLQQLLGVDRTQMLLPDEWDAQRDALIEEVGDPTKVLVLFDRNLGPGRPNGGVTYLRAYLTTETAARAAILTDTVRPDKELSEVEKLTATHQEIRPRTLLSSKDNLTVERAMSFLNRLRLTANAPKLNAMRVRFLESYDQHHAVAKERLEGLNARVLEDIVMRSSHIEGAWELDTLLRLMALFQDDAMRESLRDESGDDSVRSLLAMARELVETCYEEYPPSIAEAKKIMAGERWARIDYVNELGLPLANGDVFEINGGHYILMCQPCDLVLRSDGRRRARSTVTLLPLLAKERQESTSANGPDAQHPFPAGVDNRRHYHDLPFGFAHEPPEGVAMVFAPWHDVEIWVLDLCSFRADGAATLKVRDESSKPAALTPGIAERYKQVVKEAKKKLKLVEDCAGLGDTQRRRLTSEVLSPGQPIKPDLQRISAEREQLAYTCRRVARLSSPFAEAALAALSAERARQAYEHDLDRFGNPVAPASA